MISPDCDFRFIHNMIMNITNFFENFQLKLTRKKIFMTKNEKLLLTKVRFTNEIDDKDEINFRETT